MTELQERILDLLKEIDTLCRENDIEYYLAAGTALGAVRHKGFLPWDDDADIYMTAENWKKFYALRDNLPKDRTLITVEENFDAGYPINRYVDLTSTRLFRYLCASPQPAGMIVDIIVLDPVPGDKESIKNHIVTLTEYSNILCRATAHTHRCPYKTNYEEYLARAKKEGKDVVLRELKAKLEQHINSETDVYIQRDATVPHVWKKEVFGKPQYVPFETTELPIAEHYYEHLCGAFDEDWLNIPDGVGRVTHIKGVNLNISNNNAFSDFKKLVDMDEMSRLYTQRQELDNLQGEMLQEQSWKRLELISLKTKIKYEKKWVEPDVLLQKMNEGDFDYLDEYFSDYADVQCNKTLIGNITIGGWMRSMMPYYIDLGDDFLYVFIRYILSKGLLNKAVRIMKAREDFEELSPKCVEINDLIEIAKKSCTLMEKKDYDRVYENVAPLFEKYPENKLLMDLLYAARYLSGKAGAEDMKKEIESLAAADDVQMAIYADILWNEGSKEEAIQKYKKLAQSTNNGLILAAIKERADVDEELSEIVLIKTGDIELDESEKKTDDSEGDVGDESTTNEIGEDDDEFKVNDESQQQDINDVNKLLLDMLKEIDSICKGEGIQYFLISRSLLSAVRSHGFEDNIYTLSIAIKAEDTLKFIDAANKNLREDRFLESMINNPDFPHVALHYGAKNSIDLNTLNFGMYKNNGIKIRIEILRNDEKLSFAKAYHKIAESTWKMRGVPKSTDSKTISIYKRYDSKYNKNREEQGRKLFKKLINSGDHNSQEKFIKFHKKAGRSYYDAAWFKEAKFIDFVDMKVPVPCEYEKYLEKIYGDDWVNEPMQEPLNQANRIVDTNITYEEVLGRAAEFGVDPKDVWESRQEFVFERRKFSYVNGKIHRIWESLFFAGDRINLWEYYKDKKEEVKKAYESGDNNSFLELMEPYTEAAIRYSKVNLGMYFDDDMLDYLEKALKLMKKTDELAKIKENIPGQLDVPIKIYTHDGKLIEN